MTLWTREVVPCVGLCPVASWDCPNIAYGGEWQWRRILIKHLLHAILHGTSIQPAVCLCTEIHIFLAELATVTHRQIPGLDDK